MERIQRIKDALAIGEDALTNARNLANNPFSQMYASEIDDWFQIAMSCKVFLWRCSLSECIEDERLASSTKYFCGAVNRFINEVNINAVIDVYKHEANKKLI